MARTKRKIAGDDALPVVTANKRQKKSVEASAPSERPTRRNSKAEALEPRRTRSSRNGASTIKQEPTKSSKSVKAKTSVNGAPAEKAIPGVKITKSSKKSVKATNEPAEKANSKAKITKSSKKSVKITHNADQTANSDTKISVDVPHRKNTARDIKTAQESEVENDDEGPSYWLMKAEPESRIEKGKDVKFSIDDLKVATEPEPWNGVRNYVARNNMRLMMKGDLAFFYHSNCKMPGIAGTMEIAREHSVDETAFDPEDPYFDEKSDRENPKWCLVHVKFRQKFPELIKLKELQKYTKDGGVLKQMQVLKQSRLSVSKVTKKEWDFIMSLVDAEDVKMSSA